MFEDDEFFDDLERINNDDINVAIIRPNSHNLTDLEDLDEDDKDDTDLRNDRDVAGTLELFVPEVLEDEIVAAPSTSSTIDNTNKKRKCNESMSSTHVAVNKQSQKSKKKVDVINWERVSPKYSKTNSASTDKSENVHDILWENSAVNIFEQMFSEDIFQLILEQSEIYARQKNTTSFDLDLEHLKKFIGILIISGYHKLPQEDMYWEQASDAGVRIVFNSMSRSRFREIKRYIHLNDNSKLDKNDRFYKLRKYFDLLQKNFTKFGIFHSKLSIDEMMVRYYGKHPTKMYMHGKPIKFGYKIWCMCSSSGYLYNFDPYSGKSNDENVKPLGFRVVKMLIKAIPPDNMEDHEVFIFLFHILPMS